MPSLKDFDNLNESKFSTILKNKLSDRLQEDKTQLFEVSDVEESEEQNYVYLTDADIENNVDELASVQENISDENPQQKAETVKYRQK
jgi:hypothetical protein